MKSQISFCILFVLLLGIAYSITETVIVSSCGIVPEVNYNTNWTKVNETKGEMCMLTFDIDAQQPTGIIDWKRTIKLQGTFSSQEDFVAARDALHNACDTANSTCELLNVFHMVQITPIIEIPIDTNTTNETTTDAPTSSPTNSDVTLLSPNNTDDTSNPTTSQSTYTLKKTLGYCGTASSTSNLNTDGKGRSIVNYGANCQQRRRLLQTNDTQTVEITITVEVNTSDQAVGTMDIEDMVDSIKNQIQNQLNTTIDFTETDIEIISHVSNEYIMYSVTSCGFAFINYEGLTELSRTQGNDCNLGGRRLLAANDSTLHEWTLILQAPLSDKTQVLNYLQNQLCKDANATCVILEVKEYNLPSCSSVDDCINQVYYLFKDYSSSSGDVISEDDVTELITQINAACQDDSGETDAELFANAVRSLMASLASTTNFDTAIDRATLLRKASIDAWTHLREECVLNSAKMNDKIQEQEAIRDNITAEIERRNELLKQNELEKLHVLLPHIRELSSNQVKDDSNCVDCDDEELSNVANQLTKLQTLHNQNTDAKHEIFAGLFQKHEAANINGAIVMLNEKINKNAARQALFDQCVRVANQTLDELDDGLDLNDIQNQLTTIETDSQNKASQIDTQVINTLFEALNNDDD